MPHFFSSIFHIYLTLDASYLWVSDRITKSNDIKSWATLNLYKFEKRQKPKDYCFFVKHFRILKQISESEYYCSNYRFQIVTEQHRWSYNVITSTHGTYSASAWQLNLTEYKPSINWQKLASKLASNWIVHTAIPRCFMCSQLKSSLNHCN
jgi:hypothetical protein